MRIARTLVVWMEQNGYPDLADWEEKARQEEELLVQGAKLLHELNRREATGRQAPVDDLLDHLPEPKRAALFHVIEQNNSIIDYIEKNRLTPGSEKANELLSRIPDVLRPFTLESLNRQPRTASQGSSGGNNSPHQLTPPAQLPTLYDENNPSLDELISEWEKAEASEMAPTSAYDYIRLVRLFGRIIRERNGNNSPRIAEVTVSMIRDYKQVFASIPKGTKTTGKPISELVSESNTNRKSIGTVDENHTKVGHLLLWAKRQGYEFDEKLHSVLTSNRRPKRKDKKQRVPFDDSDLKALFNSEKYCAGKHGNASLYWAPLIGLFSGALLAEIIQLHCADIYKDSGNWVIDINANTSDKRLKVDDEVGDGATGRPRVIPIHNTLVDLGFLDFVEHQRNQGHTRLFPSEHRNSRSQFGAFSSRFRYYRDSVGAGPRTKREYRDFHSFRHLFKTKATDLSQKGGVVDDILGHTSGLRSRTGETYNHADRIKLKVELMNQVEYDCIDFEAILSWHKHRFANSRKK